MKNQYEVRGDITAIFLNRNNGDVLETLIDTADLERVKQFQNKWYSNWSPLTQSFYCHGKVNGVHYGLHRWIVQCPANMQVDHFNNDTLDNRRENLRVATPSENMQNRNGANSNARSGARGVHWESDRKKWRGLVRVKGKRIDLGRFDAIQEAEEAVKRARAEYMPFSKEAIL